VLNLFPFLLIKKIDQIDKKSTNEEFEKISPSPRFEPAVPRTKQ
jgi:hypothetical protein